MRDCPGSAEKGDKMKEFRDKIRHLINGDSNELHERIFILLTLNTICSLCIVLLMDVLMGENTVETATLFFAIILSPFVTYFSVKKMEKLVFIKHFLSGAAVNPKPRRAM